MPIGNKRVRNLDFCRPSGSLRPVWVDAYLITTFFLKSGEFKYAAFYKAFKRVHHEIFVEKSNKHYQRFKADTLFFKMAAQAKVTVKAQRTFFTPGPTFFTGPQLRAALALYYCNDRGKNLTKEIFDLFMKEIPMKSFNFKTALNLFASNDITVALAMHKLLIPTISIDTATITSADTNTISLLLKS